jgi:hypothetical protein
MTFLLDEPWVLFIAVCIALFIASVLGYRLAFSTRVNEDSHHHEHITGLREGLFIFLGLLLGFTVAMVLPRFEQRRDLVNDEAGAIETLILRTQILPEPERGKTMQLLREYVVVREGFARNTLQNQAALNRETQRTEALQEQIWQQVIAVTRDNENPVMASYMQSANNMFDVANRRLATFEKRVPKTVWLIIFVVAAFQSFLTGYSLKRKFWLSLAVTPVVVALVMALVSDLDSPRTGLIHIEQTSMQRLVNDVTHSQQ